MVIAQMNWYEQWSKAGAGPNFRVEDPLNYIQGFNWVSNWIYKYFFNRFMIINFTALAIVFQILNEVFFHFLVFVIPYNYNILVNYFKEYAKELGLLSHIGYSIMMVFVALLSSHISLYSFNINIIIFIFSTYVLAILINL